MISIAHQLLLLVDLQNRDRDVTAWNTIMKGYAESGDSETVFHLYATAVYQRNIEPDRITFIILLNACARGCLYAESRAYFHAMKDGYGILPTIYHQSCVISALGQTGQLKAALQMINDFGIGSSAIVWHLMLGLCRISGNLRLGKLAFEQALRLDKKDSAAYVLISQIYGDTSSQVLRDPPT
jgi:pentatricopeptide repeat protein